MINDLCNFFGNNSLGNLFVFLSKQRVVILANDRIILHSMNGSITESNFEIFVSIFRRSLFRFTAGVTGRRSTDGSKRRNSSHPGNG